MDKYVELAKKTIETYIKSGQLTECPPELPEELLINKAGVFVSLHKKSNHDLRGCIGTFQPTKQNIGQEIISNAVSAAFRDPRFNPLTAEELNDLEINVDVLSEPELIQSKDDLDVKKYGVIVKSKDGHLGLLLPDIDGVNNVDDQIAIACRKAGLNPSETIALYRFTVERHK